MVVAWLAGATEATREEQLLEESDKFIGYDGKAAGEA